MNNSSSFASYIALRYVSVGKRSHLVSFMSAVSVFGLVLGVAILITVLSVMNGFDREMREHILGIIPHLTITSEELVSAQQWQQIQAGLDDHPQILATQPSIQTAGVVATEFGNRGVVVNGINVAQESEVSVIKNFVIAGALEALEDNRWGIALGQELANELNVQVGDSLDLFSLGISANPLTPLPSFRKFDVLAIYRVGAQQLDVDMVIVNLVAAKALYKVRQPYTGLRIKLDNVLDADSVRQQLLRDLPPEFRVESWRSLLGNVYQNIQFSRTIIGFMLWILIGVAAFNLVVSLIMIVRDKRGDIAILRTLGASPAIINRIFLWQGCLIGLIGVVLGVTLGVVLSLQISNLALFLEAQLDMQFFNAEVYPIDFLPSQLKWLDVFMVSSGVLLLSLLATLYPARRAAAIQPAAALRTE